MLEKVQHKSSRTSVRNVPHASRGHALVSSAIGHASVLELPARSTGERHSRALTMRPWHTSYHFSKLDLYTVKSKLGKSRFAFRKSVAIV
eukprot:147831-Amphidinium_carterae.1